MIRFPETARMEWESAAALVNAREELRKRVRLDTEVEREVERLRIRHEASVMFNTELSADETPVLEMGTLADFKSNPSQAPVDLIDGVMKDKGLCILLGASGSGKSTLGLQMLHSLSTGDDWLGQTAKPLMGGFGILSYDMDASMVYDWMAGFPSIDPHKVSVVNAYKRGNPLGVPAYRQQIAADWKARGVEVVVLDSFSASFFGRDQNDAAETMQHYRDMKLFALTEVGARSLVVIAHSTEGSPGKARGSSVHHDVADSIVAVEVNAKTQSRTVRMVKYRAARGQKQMDPVIVTAPDDVTHLVDLDVSAMTLSGMHLPPGVAAMAFPEMPEAAEAPDTESDEDEEDDL